VSQEADADQQQQQQPAAAAAARTDSWTSDAETSSGDSACSTSGFSSAGSDVTKEAAAATATGSADENVATVTLGRAFKRQKPALKPKRTLCQSLFWTWSCRFSRAHV